ncbi:MAG: hypothetical protein ACOYOP_08670 [Microthrixaceae bacterium]
MTDELNGSDTGDDPPEPGALPLADEIAVGAVLDGEATDEELRRVLGEPRLVARLEELRQVRSLLGPDAVPDTATDPGPVTSLDVARTRTADRTTAAGRVAPGWIAAAAAVVLLAVGGAFVAGRSDGDPVATSSSEATTTATGGASRDREQAPGSADDSAGATTTAAGVAAATPRPAAGSAPAGTVDLGDVPDTAELARRAAVTPGVPIGAGTSGVPCADVLAGRGATAAATAAVDGTPVVVGTVPDGGLVVLDRTSCRTFGG